MSTDSDKPEGIQEACPYCARCFDVLSLVEHVNYCKNLSMTKAAEISREACSPSSHEEQASDFVSRRVEDFSLSDKKLGSNYSGEVNLLEHLDHADKCKREKSKTSSALESLQREDHDHLIVNDDDDACGGGGRPDREGKMVEKVWSSDETCDENYNDSHIIYRTGNEDDGGSDFSRGEDYDNDDNRRIEEDENITNGDGEHDSCSDEEYSILSSGYSDDWGIDEDDFVYDNEIHLSADESNMCNDDEWYANMSHTSDYKHVDAMKTSKDGAESKEFEFCPSCRKLFHLTHLIEHATDCATLNKANTEEFEQCCVCLQTFHVSELIYHAPNCYQKTVSSIQEESQDEVSANSQSSSRELLEKCMYCFKDFPVSKLNSHSQRCNGDMSGLRERFQGFLPSVHEFSAISSVAKLNSAQRGALQYVISHSAEDSKKVSSGLLTRVKGLGYSESDLTRTLQWIRSAAPIIIHINLDKVLRFLVNDTHYRNQFETGTSGGSKNLPARRSWEDRKFNDFYKHSSPSERVKYGVLNIVGDPRGVRKCARHYGDSFLQLKKVRLRTTFVSMGKSAAGVKLSCCEHFENVLFAYSDAEIKTIIDVATGKASFHRSDCISRYQEVQIHGPVSLSENVECIVVNERHQGDSLIRSLLNLFMERNNCNVIWMDPED